MSLLLAQVQGTNSFRFATAQTDVIVIARMDVGVGFADTTTTVDGVVCSEVTYNRTLNGPTSVRLDALVHDTGFTAPRRIVILAAPAGVMFNGTLVSAVAGVALDLGDAGNPFTNSLCAIYDADDCGGTGHWVDQEGGGTTSFPRDVVLYHELAHCFHFATGVATSEPLAETDENVMRDARGLPHRNTASHNGGCGGGPTSCCIIASLATGSAYSGEVQRLRHFREHALRRSTVGDDFFERFFYRYYHFSPEVTRLMGRKPNLAALIKDKFVLPLLAAVELLIHYSERRGQGLSAFLRDQSTRQDLAQVCEEPTLAELAGYLAVAQASDQTLASRRVPHGERYDGMGSLLRYFRQETLRDEYIAWPLLEVMELWVQSAALLYSGRSEVELDVLVSEKIAEWLGRMPVSAVWSDLSRLELELELRALEQFMFDPRSKEAFAQRLLDEHPRHQRTVLTWASTKEDVDA